MTLSNNAGPDSSLGIISTKSSSNGYALSFPDRRDLFKDQNAEEVPAPEIEESLSFDEYLEKAKNAPDLYLRNTGKYLADAMSGYGVSMVSSYGKMLPHYHCLEANWLPKTQTQRKVPVDMDETIDILHKKLSEIGRQARAEKAILLRSAPGFGKDLIYKRLIQTFENYSQYHPKGMQYRLAFRFRDESVANKILGFATNQIEKSAIFNNEKSHQYTISSSLICNPIFLLSNRTDRNLKSHNGQNISEREELILQCNDSQKALNSDYVLANEIDPTSSIILKALTDFYGSREKALKEHVFAERWHYDSKMVEGIYIQMPYKDPHSYSKPLLQEHPLKGKFIPEELLDYAKKIPEIISPLAGAKLIYYQDIFADNPHDRGDGDISRLGYLLSLIEYGDLQLGGENEGMIVNQDAIIFASANDKHLDAKQNGKTWEPFRKRFSVIAVPGIRQFKFEVDAHKDTYELSIGQEITTCPHVLESLCLFLTATRMINPKRENYKELNDVTDEKLGTYAEKLKGIRKALFFQSPTFLNRNTELNLSPEWDKLSNEEIKVLRNNEWIVAHEYLKDMEKSRFGLYDGGFGISTRDAHVYLDSLSEKVRYKKYASVLDVIEVLKEAADAGFEYYEEFHESKINYLARLYKQLCIERNVDAIDPSNFISSPKSPFDKQKEIYNEALGLAESRFPISPPKILLHETTLYAKYKVSEDLKSILLPESPNESLLRYFFHAWRLQSRGISSIPDDYKNSDSKLGSKDKEIPEGVDLQFVTSFENLLLGDNATQKARESFRDELIMNINSWHDKNPSGTKFLQNKSKLFELDIFRETVHKIKEERKSEDNKKIYHFWQQSLRYNENPEFLKNDLEQEGTKTEASQWHSQWLEIEKLGYHPESILKHYRFAFDEIIKSEGKSR